MLVSFSQIQVRMFPCTKISSKKSFPVVLCWQKEAKSLIFLAPKPERGHIRQNRPFTKPPFCFLSTQEGGQNNTQEPLCQEDVNGEKLTVKKWWIFGADFFHGLVPIFSRFVRDINGEKKTSRYR